MVPSVAIKEGVNKTLEITRDHLEGLYPGAKGYEFFQYDSAKLGQVRNFATSPNVQIMVITVGAINKFGDEDEAVAIDAAQIARAQKDILGKEVVVGASRVVVVKIIVGEAPELGADALYIEARRMQAHGTVGRHGEAVPESRLHNP